MTYKSSYNFWDKPALNERICDHPECDQPGIHRAPRSPQNLREYYWFCLEHVREYNKAWNYCQGMSSREIEQMERDAHCWDRPTWPMGMMGAVMRDGFSVEDDLGAFVKNRGANTGQTYRRQSGSSNGFTREQDRALKQFGLKLPFDHAALKKAFKELARANHPDLHPNDPEATDRFKRINENYERLKPLAEPASKA